MYLGSAACYPRVCYPFQEFATSLPVRSLCRHKRKLLSTPFESKKNKNQNKLEINLFWRHLNPGEEHSHGVYS